MRVLVRGNFPANRLEQAVAAYRAAELPQRSPHARELGSFVYGDGAGYHTLFVFDVADEHLAEVLQNQAVRSVYFEAHVDGFQADVTTGMAVEDGLAYLLRQALC